VQGLIPQGERENKCMPSFLKGKIRIRTQVFFLQVEMENKRRYSSFEGRGKMSAKA